MIRILDWYILKRYLGTFVTLFLIFIPIGIMANLAEKIDNIFDNEVPFKEVVKFYGNFTIHFANLLFPLLLFISVIWFTSKLANKTEIIAFLSSGVSFNRFLRPYIIGATIVSAIALYGGMFVVPKASKNYNEFKNQYLSSSRKKEQKASVNLYRQVDDNEFIYAYGFYPKEKIALRFTLEHFENDKMTHKISARRLKYREKDSIFELSGYVKRTITDNGDIIETKSSLDTVFNFDIDKLTPVSYVAETLNYKELKQFVKEEEKRGSPNLNAYKVVQYKRWSLPVAAYILTIIAVSVSSIKRRGGMGANLAFGLVIAFGFVFFDKVFGTLAVQSDFSPLIAVWFPNVVFAVLAMYLLARARR